ncbi:MAG: sigma-54-dependent Fis family transcriptional regulator, partial [Thermacetogeniaceae bacterium]
MSVANRALTDVALAWMKFGTTGEIDVDAVRPEIAESWKRCYKAGVNPYDGICRDILEASELEKLLEKHKDLIEIARPFMTNLYQFFKGSGYIVMLTDNRGYIIEAFGDDSTLKNAIGLNFIKGANWTEESVGTNAIGTALVLKKPIQVSGPEHYCCKHHPWTCSAAPIFDHEGNVMGILDLSGPSDEAHLHTLGMVVAAVEAIREQMLLRQKNRELTLANNQLRSIIQSMSDGVIAFDARGMVTQVNPAAEQIIGRRGSDLIGRSVKEILGDRSYFIDQLLDEHDSFSEAEVIVDSLGGMIHCLISGKPILDDCGVITGGLIFVRPIEKVQKLVNRFSGAQATFYFKDIIGESAGIKEAIKMAALAASSMSTVLLQGESGTGKELFAQAIHNHSPRRRGPFVAVNCGAIPRELIASELFGYEEGAFTGAKRGGRPGKFELASGGTLFLDEIGEMPLEQQVALLRVLQEKK